MLPLEVRTWYHKLASVSDLPSGTESSGTSTLQCSESACTAFCYSDLMKPFQSGSEEGLACLTSNGCKFVPKWFQQYPWLTVCSTTRKSFVMNADVSQSMSC